MIRDQGFITSIGTFQAPTSLCIHASNKIIVTIRPDGTIEYGEGYTPDDAARALWDAVGLERKQRVA